MSPRWRAGRKGFVGDRGETGQDVDIRARAASDGNISIRTESETKGADTAPCPEPRWRVVPAWSLRWNGCSPGVRPRRMARRVGRGVLGADRGAERAVGEDADGRETGLG